MKYVRTEIYIMYHKKNIKYVTSTCFLLRPQKKKKDRTSYNYIDRSRVYLCVTLTLQYLDYLYFSLNVSLNKKKKKRCYRSWSWNLVRWCMVKTHSSIELLKSTGHDCVTAHLRLESTIPLSQGTNLTVFQSMYSAAIDGLIY